MRLPDVISATTILAAGVGGGLILGDTITVVGDVITSITLTITTMILQIKPLVTIDIAINTITNLFIRTTIIHVLYLPNTCTGLEAFGGTVTAGGAIVGVGVVVALATRSFDEYHKTVEAGRPPPEPGCETDQDGHD